MIIDFTRRFTEEKYNSYCDLFDLWWEKYEEHQRSMYDAENNLGELYDEEAAIMQTPNCWLDLLDCDTFELNLTADDLTYLDELCKQTDILIKELKKQQSYCTEVYWPQNKKERANMLRFLEEKNAMYYLIYHPHPNTRDVLLIKDELINREFKILFEEQYLNRSTVDWLINSRGWMGTTRVEDLEYYELVNWLENTCLGFWLFNRQFNILGSVNMIFFQYETDLVLYQLRFKGTLE